VLDIVARFVKMLWNLLLFRFGNRPAQQKIACMKSEGAKAIATDLCNDSECGRRAPVRDSAAYGAD
jgi:hypothetical protein